MESFVPYLEEQDNHLVLTS